ncbi:DNA gyrase inhibitor YacG [Sphingomonas montana]|uniref:DNA gyrase inhibitor YacG n=1 Tax=Sphingomonas montana TaxID=1843236 RepID=UPI0019D2EBCB|nr:DNA gyrase inhibitor YacG [Sphingomonas montana]
MSRPITPRRARSGCPVCGAPVTPAYDPFCSQGCRDRDLLQWLGDGYRVPGPPVEDSDQQDT